MNTEWKKELIKLIDSTRGKGELSELLTAILSPLELEDVVKRWQIVKRLIEGASQREIRDELGVSIATITRGSREIQYGNGIFNKFYKRLYGNKCRLPKSI